MIVQYTPKNLDPRFTMVLHHDLAGISHLSIIVDRRWLQFCDVEVWVIGVFSETCLIRNPCY